MVILKLQLLASVAPSSAVDDIEGWWVSTLQQQSKDGGYAGRVGNLEGAKFLYL